jgi:hypothetical protein
MIGLLFYPEHGSNTFLRNVTIEQITWRHIPEADNLKFHVIRIIKSRKISWVEYVACMEEMRNIYKILVG